MLTNTPYYKISVLQYVTVTDMFFIIEIRSSHLQEARVCRTSYASAHRAGQGQGSEQGFGGGRTGQHAMSLTPPMTYVY